jgi:hypothetical protein
LTVELDVAAGSTLLAAEFKDATRSSAGEELTTIAIGVLEGETLVLTKYCRGKAMSHRNGRESGMFETFKI